VDAPTRAVEIEPWTIENLQVSGARITARTAWLPFRAVQKWRYGLTLLPRETASDGDSLEATVEAVVRSRRDLGWELVRKAERDDSELLVFRRPA
jgi:hypothetical protein